MTKRKRPARTIARGKLDRLSKILGGRGAIAEAIGMSRPAVDRYFIGKGMQQETFDALQGLLRQHGILKDRQADPSGATLLPEPPTLEESGGHLYRLLVKALARNSDVGALQAQLNRIERRLDRMEQNQERSMRAWQLDPTDPVPDLRRA